MTTREKIAAMPSKSHELHFVLIPLMCPGHQTPMVDMGRLLAQRGVVTTIVTTPQNAARFNSIIDRAIESGLPIQLLQLHFPALEVGLPEGCENIDSLPSHDLVTTKKFFPAVGMLQQPLEKLFEELQPSPSCIVSDRYLPWTAQVARKFRIPRLLFDGTNCFSVVCSHNISISRVYENLPESQPFVVPGLPDNQVEFTRAQLPSDFNPGSIHMTDLHEDIIEAENEEYGLIVNTFEELEREYVKECRKLKYKKVWCIGPVSLSNKEHLDKAQRGNQTSIDANQCSKWLDSWAPSSVVYACLGSISCLTTPQLIELGLGLEASNRPFIWAIRGGNNTEEIKKWMLDHQFEERMKGRGLLIWGWAPQLLILSHKAIGAFLTHCGWNSILEGVCVGVPMITWPLCSDQFYNEKFVVQILRIGVRVGAEVAVKWGEEETFEVLITKEKVKKGIDQVIDGGEGGQERRNRARELGETANKAMEVGGSSYLSMTLLVQDILQQVTGYQN